MGRCLSIIFYRPDFYEFEITYLQNVSSQQKYTDQLIVLLKLVEKAFHLMHKIYKDRYRVEVVKASLDLTGKYPNTNKGRIGFLDECS